MSLLIFSVCVLSVLVLGLIVMVFALARQIGILFYYLFNELGIDFTNSDKSAWAPLLSFITGYSEETLRKKLDFDFENKQVQKDLGTVKAEVQELFPAIARKIDNDKKI